MIGFLVYLTVLGILFATALIGGVSLLARLLVGDVWAHFAAAILIVIGTIPPTVMAVFWYARSADYRWAIRGPGLFAQLGGGPAMLAAFVMTCLTTAICWTAAVWLVMRAHDDETAD